MIHGRRRQCCDDTKSGAQAKARRARTDAERGVATPHDALAVEEHLRRWLDAIQPAVRASTHRSCCDLSYQRVRATLSGALRAAMLDYGLPRKVASLA